jgi:dTDP-4-amino-4,6-dideoxygalactose transaminase
LWDHLKSLKIGAEVYYPIPVHLQPCYAFLGGSEGDLPVTETAAAEVLSLPIYPELTTDQIDTVAEAIISWVQSHAPVA